MGHNTGAAAVLCDSGWVRSIHRFLNFHRLPGLSPGLRGPSPESCLNFARPNLAFADTRMIQQLLDRGATARYLQWHAVDLD